MLPLPVPEPGGAIDDLAGFLNLPGRDDFVLVVAWLLAALRSGGPYPLLGVSGEQGTAKTFLTKVLRALVDPNVAPLRAAPRENRELFIAPQKPHARLRQPLQHAAVALRHALPAGERRRLRGAPALFRSG